jgi:16S rRNA (uracil1498-N3)-methyltransferase
VAAPWFYAPDLEPSQLETVLPADESHHLTRVMRVARGDEVIVFDGRGRRARGRVARSDRNAVVVAILETFDVAEEPSTPITLVQAVLKGNRMDDVVRDATMAGVARIVPMLTKRTLLGADALARAHAGARWQRVAVASAKQCRRALLPGLDPVVSMADWLRTPFHGLRLMLVEPEGGGPAAASMRSLLGRPKPPAVACLIGPEGGWTAAECEAAVKAGYVTLSLGPLTLRADAVALVASSLLGLVFADS